MDFLRSSQRRYPHPHSHALEGGQFALRTEPGIFDFRDLLFRFPLLIVSWHNTAVRKWRIVIILAACLIAAFALVTFFSREKEPTWSGQPLSYWVFREDRQHEASGEKAQADTAIRQIGTNALPFLLKWIQHERPRWRSTAFRLARKLPFWNLADWIKEGRAEILARNPTLRFQP